MSAPTIEVSQSGNSFDITVKIDEDSAKDSECVVMVVAVLASSYIAYNGFAKQSKWTDGSTEYKFDGCKIQGKGTFKFCATTNSGDTNNGIAYSDTYTVS